MKNLKIIFVSIMVLICCYITPFNNLINNLKKKFVGHYLHELAKKCAMEDPKFIAQVMGVGMKKWPVSGMKSSDIIDSINYKVNGKTAIEVARESHCDNCDPYIFILESWNIELQRIVHERGDITIQEIIDNKDLLKEMRQNTHALADNRRQSSLNNNV